MSFTKAFTHGYAQSVVAASQSSYASSTTLNHLAQHPAAKFSRTTQLQNVFQPSSSSGAGAGAKASQGGSGGGDLGVAAYYAAWQQAQQTGDDSDWKQLQSSRRVGRKLNGTEEDADGSDAAAGADASSEYRDPPHLTRASANADVSAQVEEAVAREIEIQEEQARVEEAEAKDGAATEAFPELPDEVASIGDATVEQSRRSSDHIVDLASGKQFAEIPGAFAALLRDGLTPTVGAYNALLESAVQLHGDAAQAIQKALDVYSDMLRRRVVPDEQTYETLVRLFVVRAHETITAKGSLEQDRARFGGMEKPGEFMLMSSELERAIVDEDHSLGIAMKLFTTATTRHADFVFSLDTYRQLITACAREGQVEAMVRVYAHMESNKVTPHASIFPPMIDAFASTGDLQSAVECYNEYKALAIADDNGTFSIVQRRDGEVYAALVQAYMSCGKEDDAMRFVERIRGSFDGVTDDRSTRQDALESVIVRDGLRALEQAHARLRDGARNQAIAAICVAAADAGDLSTASRAYDSLPNDDGALRRGPAVSLLALHVRQGHVTAARPLWLQLSTVDQATADLVQPTTMYAVALLKSGQIDPALLETRNMFARIRTAAADQQLPLHPIREQINESLDLVGRVLIQTAAVLSPSAIMTLLWSMADNGGMVFPLAEHAVANLGPVAITHLAPADLTLALQVQAGMLVHPRAAARDVAHPIRFAHLLDVALATGRPLDAVTAQAVDQAVGQLFPSRPDLVQRWHDHRGMLMSPVSRSPSSFPSDRHTPVSERSALTSAPSEDAFDPYASATDFRGSALIAEALESASGRLEPHLNRSLDRLRDMRRAGRHPRYITYAKMITAAAKVHRLDLAHEILNMARRDVPALAQYPAVQYGWVSILDAMVAACLTLGDRHLAAKYHQELRTVGSAPSANTFGLYITTLKESTKTFDEATEALKIFHRAVAEGVEPTSFLYNALIGKLGKARRIDDCLLYFAEMRARGVRPTSVTYGTVVNALCRVSDERFAEEMFEEMESMPNYKPRPAPYNSMIQYFLTTKRDRRRVLAYYERMRRRNIAPTMHTYKLLIDAHASLEPVDMPAAEQVLETMRQSGPHPPEAVHYAALIHAQGCVTHDLDAALRLFRSVVADPTVRVQPCLYQAVLEALVANNQVGQTEAIVADMSRRGVEMTAYIANTLIQGWAAAGDLNQAQAVYGRIGLAKREPSTYEAMTRAYLQADDRAGAARTVQEMLSRGYPNAVASKIVDLRRKSVRLPRLRHPLTHSHIARSTSFSLFTSSSLLPFSSMRRLRPFSPPIYLPRRSTTTITMDASHAGPKEGSRPPKKLIFAPGDLPPPDLPKPHRLQPQQDQIQLSQPSTPAAQEMVTHPARAHQFIINPPLTISQMHPTNPLHQFHSWFRDPRLSAASAPETCTLATAELPSGRVSARVVYLKELDERGWTIYSNWGSREGKGRQVFGPDSAASGLKGGSGSGSGCDNFPPSIPEGEFDGGNRWAALTFFWAVLERQVRVEGLVEPLPRAESEVYWRTRERGSQIGAWASYQSKVLWEAGADGLEGRRGSLAPVIDGAGPRPAIPLDVGDTDIDDGRALLERRVREMEERFAGVEQIPLPPFWGGVRVVPESVEFWQGRKSRLHDRFRYVRVGGGDGGEGYRWRIERMSP
ncbi:hypothetical protein P168DRAFT_297647 [Aspergillus campestris IBT 28561]|uniref:Uncharacterized protein n=1 Tax=Aspergillus campestris (strain IBT 28561) TaxID=1392248 RepID=A0A2I1D1L4_ASPC2|nr:uncharacterized protein P168DRAFT_297647 [Aspergillus campestris IBT 28561]PKY03765.1 hypothetical protein P168DRAFT_297647 [Aspergillus campestris IBT 28561]